MNLANRNDPSLALQAGVPTHRRRSFLLAGLVLLALVPRIGMALKIGGLCPDAVVYIRIAQAYDRGTLLDDKHNRFALNVYPAVLMALHRGGIDWEMAGKLWGVVIGSLTVLPLYGWVRRQFDERTAVCAAVLCALHAEMIRTAPEGIRDPTFWFLWVLALYFLWRAAREASVPCFLGAGVTVALAALTRIEGLFLFIPLAGWLIHAVAGTRRVPSALWSAAARRRFSSQPAFSGTFPSGTTPGFCLRSSEESASNFTPLLLKSEGKPSHSIVLLGGAVLTLIVLPLLLLLVAKIWFPLSSPWELFRTKPLEIVDHWWHGRAMPSSGNVPAAESSAGRWLSMSGVYGLALARGFTPAFALLLAVGLWDVWGRWDLWRRRTDIAPLLLASGAFMLAIWMHLYVAEDTSRRYFLPIVLMAAPLAARGAMTLAAAFRSNVLRWAPLGLYAALSLGNVMVCDYSQRALPKIEGRWIAEHCHSAPRVLGPPGVAGIVAYYAGGETQVYADGASEATIEQLCRAGKSDALILPAAGNASRQAEQSAWTRRYGFEAVDDSELAGGLRRLRLYVHTNPKR